MKKNHFAGISPELQAILLPMQAQIESLQRQLGNKDAEIVHLKEVIATYQRMLFGSKSEKTRYLNQMDQLSLFHAEETPERKTEEKKRPSLRNTHGR